MRCSQQFEMAGQLVEHRFIIRPERQNRLGTGGNLRMACIMDKVRRDVEAVGVLTKRIEILRFWSFQTDLFLARGQPRLGLGWMRYSGVEEGLNRGMTHLSCNLPLAHFEGLVDHTHELDRSIAGAV